LWLTEGKLQETVTDVIVGGGGVIEDTVTAAEPVFVESCVLVAVMVTLPAVAGAVKFPLASIDPPVAVHLTELSKLPVPLTAAEHWEAPPTRTVVGEQETLTDEIVLVDCVMVREAVPDFEVSCVLAAVIVALVALASDAVNRPLVLMVPPVADHLTAVL